MTEKQRVLLNVAATYGRTMFSIACGLFAGRWALMALGEVDYGLYGVVGGLTGFIAFINSLMASAVGRFYAYSVGESRREGGEGVEICRKWFNTALVIHTVVPVVLILIGYPIAEWAVRNWLTIPVDRVEDCVVVLRCVCITCFIGMVNVPFTAMYTAKQYIAELTVYSVVQTAANVVFLYYMVSHPGVWLKGYAIWCCLMNGVPMLIIACRAMMVFPECRFRRQYLFNLGRFRELFVFAAYRFGGAVCDLINEQGIVLLVNKKLGPAKNAAMAIGNTVSGYSQMFSEAIASAVYPVVTNACGEGNLEKMRRWSFSACRLSALLSLIFVLPLLLEVDEVMVIWLKTPPAGAAVLCVFFMLRCVLENMTCGYYMSIFSVGDIKRYQLALCFWGLALSVPLTWALLCVWPVLAVVGGVLLLLRCVCVAVRLHYGWSMAGLSAALWWRTVALPIVAVSALSMIGACFVRYSLPPSFWRVCLTTVSVEIVFLPLAFFFVLSAEERSYFADRFGGKFVRRFMRQ